MKNTSDIREKNNSCPICGNTNLYSLACKLKGFDYCSKCNLLFVNPQPNEQSLNNLYSEEYFTMRGYDNKDKQKYRLRVATKRLGRIERGNNLSKQPGKSLLDIGCASGYFLHVSQKRGYSVYGVEKSGYAVRQAFNLFNLSIIEGELGKVNLPISQFDLITAWDLFEHIIDPNGFLELVHGLLASTGILIIHIPVIDSLGYRLHKHRWKKINALEHLFYYSYQSFLTIIHKHGFEIISPPSKLKRFLINLGSDTMVFYLKKS